MQYRTRFYLVLDRTDDGDPRWVIAQGLISRPADVPDGLTGPGAAWLRTFSQAYLVWLAHWLGFFVGLTVPMEGFEGFCTRIVDFDHLLADHGRWFLGWTDEAVVPVDDEDGASDEGSTRNRDEEEEAGDTDPGDTRDG